MAGRTSLYTVSHSGPAAPVLPGKTSFSVLISRSSRISASIIHSSSGAGNIASIRLRTAFGGSMVKSIINRMYFSSAEKPSVFIHIFHNTLSHGSPLLKRREEMPFSSFFFHYGYIDTFANVMKNFTHSALSLPIRTVRRGLVQSSQTEHVPLLCDPMILIAVH